jgi:hypothetical protein
MGRPRLYLLGAGVVCTLAVASREAFPADFVRGDFQQSGEVDIGDALRIMAFLYQEISPDDPCIAAADVDGDGSIQPVDAIRLFNYLFLTGEPPGAPFPEPGLDPVPDSGRPGCAEYGPVAPSGDPGIVLDVISKGEYMGAIVYPAMVRIAATVEGVEAWSFGLTADAELCQIFSATTAGTLLHEEYGFRRTELIFGPKDVGVVSAQAVAFDAPVYIPSDGTPQDILAIEWTPTGPLQKKVVFHCPLRFVDGLQGTGAPVNVRAVRNNVSVIPTALDVVIDSSPFIIPRFIPGDCNMDDEVDISDPLFLLNFLFGDGSEPLIPEACDADGNFSLQITDAIRLLNHLFSGGPPPVR